MDSPSGITTCKDNIFRIRSNQGKKDARPSPQNGRAICHTRGALTNLDKTGRQAYQPPPTNAENLTFKQRISKAKSFITTQLTGVPDFNDPDKTLDYINSLEKQKKIKPFTRRLLTDIATHEQRVEILEKNLPFTYDLLFHNAEDPAKKDSNYVALHEQNPELWHNLLIADGIPEADKNILRERKLSVCIVLTLGAPEEASSSDESGFLEWDDSDHFGLVGGYHTTPLIPED